MSAITFDPGAVAEAVATRLPIFGRDADERAVLEMLADPSNRLITVTGPGGVGKTRFGLQIAKHAAALFPGGVKMVSLAAIREAARLVSAILHAISPGETGALSEIEAIVEAIGDQRTLLVLDNMEQIIEAGPQLTAIIARSPGTTMLVTSRTPLRLVGEIEYPLRSLMAPSTAGGVDIEAVSANPAVQLFIQRARAIRSDFTITSENVAAVAEICRRLDGLPLAIELAAARTKVLSPQALLSRLTHSLQVLTGGPRDAPARLQSMRDAIGWSYALLDSDHQRFFRKLGAFSGGISLEAAEAIADPNALDLIATLVDHSLVVPLQHIEDEPRFGLLETIREYAVESLVESGELDDVRARHATSFAQFAAARAAKFMSAGETEAMDRVEREVPNLRAALEWLNGADPELAAALTSDLWYFWGVRGHYREGLDWVNRLDARGAEMSLAARSRLHSTSGFLHWAMGTYERATAEFESALKGFGELGDRQGVAIAHFGLGSIYRDTEAAEPATRELNAALEIFEELNFPAWTGFSLSVLGALRRQQGAYDEAIVVLERGLAINRAIGYPGGISPIVDHLGDIARERGDNDQALTYYRESLAAWLHLRDPHGAADSLAGFAVALLGLGDPEGATRLLSAAGAVYEGLGFSRSRYGPAYKDDVITALRDQLGDERLDELWIGGQELTLESALQEAIAYSPRIGRAPHVTIPPKASSRMERFGLTQREAETLELLIEGKSNAEIGARLSISPRTAGTHIANIYGKIGVSSRAALVAAVLRGDTQA